MSKAYHMCVASVGTSCVGIILAGYNFFAKTLSYHSRGILIIFSCALIFLGIISFLTAYKHYLSIKYLLKGTTPIIARWTYQPDTSATLSKLIRHQKYLSLFIATIYLIFAEVFIFLFVSGEPTIPIAFGFFIAVLVFFSWIIICRFTLNYYVQLIQNESMVLFSKDCIYFLDNVYYLVQGVHILENVEIYYYQENLLIFDYGLGDVDSHESLIIPIPIDKEQVALYLKNYYCSVLPLQEDDD